MDEDLDTSKTLGNTVKGLIKSNQTYKSIIGNNHIIKCSTSSGKVSILKNVGGKKNWILRLDKPHKGVPYNHININPKISKIRDPHIPLPPGSLVVGESVAKICQKVNAIATPVAIACDTISTGVSVYNDCINGTTRNTIETVTDIAGGWVGSYIGVTGGAAIGSTILPDIGTIVGGIIGAIVGGIQGTSAASSGISNICDSCDYDIDVVYCKKCGTKFKIRIYLGEKKSEFCSDCIAVKEKVTYYIT